MKKLQISAEVIVPDALDMNDHFESLKTALAGEFGVEESAVEIASVEESHLPD
jgi:hypothetical protein